VLDGVVRETAARSSGMDRQTLRDWAHRFNAEGIEGLSDRNGKGAKPRLSPKQQAQFVAWVEAGPDPLNLLRLKSKGSVFWSTYGARLKSFPTEVGGFKPICGKSSSEVE
jgi:transposase